MHRCIAILGPTIRVLYRDLSIAIRIVIRIAIHITYRDQCIAYVIRITMPQEAHHVMSTLRDNACIAIRVSIPPPAARRSI